MAVSDHLFAVLKQRLKAQGLSYCKVAHLQVSESSVKRMFSKCNISLECLVQICELLNLSLAELTREAEESLGYLNRLSAD